MKGNVARALRFGDLLRGVDTDLLDRARLADVLTYSADRFSYVSIRGTDRRSHTWSIADTGLMMTRAGSLVFLAIRACMSRSDQLGLDRGQLRTDEGADAFRRRLE